jgi:ParB family chromosome partitioning protein
MPELRHVPLSEIDEPALPMRAKMDDTKLAELMNSITNIGQQLPAQVKMVNGRYQIVSGHRRFIALGRMSRDTMMCLVYGPDEKLDVEAMVSENEDREEVNAAEQGLFYAQLMEQRSWGEEELCRAVKRTPDYIADRLRLLRQDPLVFQAVLNGDIPFSVAREVNKVKDEAVRRSYLDQAIRSGTSARVVARWVGEWRGSLVTANDKPTPPSEAPAPASVEPYHFCCAVCGGDKDPYNLATINVHRWEWEAILRVWVEYNKNLGGES